MSNVFSIGDDDDGKKTPKLLYNNMSSVWIHIK